MISVIILMFFFNSLSATAVYNKSISLNTTAIYNKGTALPGIEFPYKPTFNGECPNRTTVETLQVTEADKDKIGGPTEMTLKLHLKHRAVDLGIRDYSQKDLNRIQSFHQKITGKNQKTMSRITKLRRQLVASAVPEPESRTNINQVRSTSRLVATVGSGFSLGSGDYLMDVFMGTPPKHFSLILDTGSDLNWIQCLPCHDCFQQHGSPYNPKESSSFRNVSCRDPLCKLVSSPDPRRGCKSEDQNCEYFYWYGDSSNSTGDFALETFMVNVTTASGKSGFQQLENVMFGCGHWNRGLFHGAHGILGLGRGPLSFSSQLQSLFGHGFSYCLVDWNSTANISSKLIFGADKSLISHPNLNFTSFVAGKENPVNTFYYVQIQAIVVGGEQLDIPAEVWNLSPEGSGGTIIDSGTTLSYFVDPAYRIIQEAFRKKVKNYQLIEDIPMLDTCYNVSGAKKVEIPEFAILFGDGAVWNFPVENYFTRMDHDEVLCLAFLEAPQSISILGNYQQQNFHILYDTQNSRLGFAPMRCADV